MGTHPNVGYNKFLKQSGDVNKLVHVCFGYDVDHTKLGRIVRDDTEAPYIMLIRLEDGRYVRSTECQYSFPPKVRINGS